MEIKLLKKPKNPTIIEGFPGFGLIGTVVTEFLLDHLDVESIGTIVSKDIPAMIAIHEGKVVSPIEIFYNKKYNLVILHVVTSVVGLEWDMAQTVIDLAKQLNAKELVSIEGVGSANAIGDSRTFYYSNVPAKRKKFEQIKINQLKEGIVMGVTGTLLLKAKTFKQPLSCIFAETRSDLPDSKAAARVVQVLDSYLGLKVDPKPLVKQAEKFEKKIKTIMQKGKEASTLQEKKQLSYVG
ncbi:proteasome assembly chaperone family protein [Nanoarchaeota archaeon]